MKKLLLIEDDKDLSRMYARKFNSAGWDVTTCYDGSEAINIAKQKRFDMIVLDLMLPGISGVDVLEILRSDSKTVRTPIVVYTNYGDSFNREKCMSYGADDFILKVDSTPEALTQTIEQIMMLKGTSALEEDPEETDDYEKA